MFSCSCTDKIEEMKEYIQSTEDMSAFCLTISHICLKNLSFSFKYRNNRQAKKICFLFFCLRISFTDIKTRGISGNTGKKAFIDDYLMSVKKEKIYHHLDVFFTIIVERVRNTSPLDLLITETITSPRT